MSSREQQFFIDGAWIDPVGATPWHVVNPATEEVAGTISLGTREHVNMAVVAARTAFPAWADTPPQERLARLKAIVATYKTRSDDLAMTVTREMGSPIGFSKMFQVPMAIAHMEETIRVFETYAFEEMRGRTMLRREPIGVVGLITAWNWPLNLIISKLSAALAAGCTVVLKPSENAPLSALLLAEIIAESGLPRGVFNLVNGDGPTVGSAISMHSDIDMVSFTGSTRAGAQIARDAADGIKRVVQELGGKSANIILPSANLDKVVPEGVMASMLNAGQSCQAPTRMLVHRSQRNAAVELARRTIEARVVLGDTLDPSTNMGPLANRQQFERVQAMIASGIAQGATVVTGGLGHPEGFHQGFYVRPTVFADATPDMQIAQEEIFGPVLTMISYDDEDHAVEIANGTDYGLASYVEGATIEEARRVAKRMRAGRVYLNGAMFDRTVPFGGYKKSGNGREYSVWGIEEYTELKAEVGYEPAYPRASD